MDEYGFGSCQERGTSLAALCKVYSLVEGDHSVELFLSSWAQPLSSSLPRHFGQFHAHAHDNIDESH